MKRVLDFLKDVGIYYLGTVDGYKPKIRPFGTINLFEDKLYIQSGKKKDVAKQIEKNPNFEICAFSKGKWIRVSGELVEDDRFEAKKSMLDAYPELRGMYSEDDGNTVVYYIKNGKATISSFGEAPEEIEF